MATRDISEYQQLLNTLRATQRVVYLCGADASMSLGSHRLSWASWIIEGKKYLTKSEQGELDRKIGLWTSDELIDAATFLLGSLKRTDLYRTFMDKTIGSLHPANTEFKDALRWMWRAGDIIARTNYDMQIEEALNAKGDQL